MHLRGSLENVSEISAGARKDYLAQEISSKKVGDMVMNGLKALDEVAYVRYASVHRQFKDINTLLEEIEKLVADKTNPEDGEK